MILRNARIAALCAAVVLASAGAGRADVAGVTADFLVLHQFARFKIAADETRSFHVFLDLAPFTVSTLSASEQDELHATATDLLKSRVALADKKEDANLIVQIRMFQGMNYTVRNRRHEPSQGVVMVGICRYPTMTAATDCENLSFFYFADATAGDVFRKAFMLWLDTIFPPAAH
jgi:hypothetical protein